MIVYIIIGWAFFLGVATGYLIRVALAKARAYAGIIQVKREDDKLSYTIELVDDPWNLQFEQEVLFKIETPSNNLSRE